MRVTVLYNKHPSRGEKDLADAAIEECAHDVAATLVNNGHAVDLLGVGPGEVPLEELHYVLSRSDEDVVFNLCENVGGKPIEAYVAGLLELLGKRYTGSPVSCLVACVDKARTKQLLQAQGIPTPRYAICASEDDPVALNFPLMVKPVGEDASIGIDEDSIVHDPDQMRLRVKYVLDRFGPPALVEEYVEGREINVAVVGHPPEALPPSEIDFSGLPEGVPWIVSYRSKWVEDSSEYRDTPPICPADLDPDLAANIQDLALRAYDALGCRDYARVDFRVRDGVPYVLEVNPNPDISLGAGLARAALVAGLSYEDLIEKVVECAMQRI